MVVIVTNKEILATHSLKYCRGSECIALAIIACEHSLLTLRVGLLMAGQV